VLYERWFPQLVWDVHQFGNRGARYFIPPFADPLNPNIDPLIVRMTNLVGVQIAHDLTAAGKTGVSHQQTFDLWWHGGGRTVPARHNMVGILSEAASADYGDPIEQHPDSLRQPTLGSMYPEPWPGGRWSPRDIVEYELVNGRSLVGLMHRQRDTFIRNFVTLGRRQVALGEAGGPFAYIVPADQRDPGSAKEMLRVLQRGGVEVHEAERAFTAGGRSYPAGTRVVLMAQPYRAHAKDLLERQVYPDRRLYPGGPPDAPYDVAGWTLPLQMGVDVVEVARPFSTEALELADVLRPHAGRVQGEGRFFALDPRMNHARRALHEVVQAGGRVAFATQPVQAGELAFPAGAPVVSGLRDLEERVERWTGERGVDAIALEQAPAEAQRMDRLRVGLYKPWTASMDEGWTRWVFEQWDVPFDTIKDAQMRAGNLGRRFDVIVVPDLSYTQMTRGLDARRSPAEFAGGLGDQGVAALKRFVEQGGTLVLMNNSSEFAIREFELPVRNVNAEQETGDPDRWFAPGSLLRVRWNEEHPLAWGMPQESAVYYARSPVFAVEPDAERITIVASYPERDILLSGYAQGEDRIAGRAALLEAEIGRGRVVMFGFRPQHRGQPHDTFRVLFNSLYRR
jgi:hypothetical protein